MMCTALQVPGSPVLGTLRQCGLFQGRPAAELESVASMTEVVRLEADEFLMREGGAMPGFCIVHEGAIKLYRRDPGGRTQVLHVFRHAEAFGAESLGSEASASANASAVGPAQVLVVRTPRFLARLRRQPELALCLLRSMDQNLRMLIERVDDLTLKDAKTRLAQWLLQQCPQPIGVRAQTVALPMTKRALAAELGTTGETVSRMLAKLRAQRLLTVAGPAVTLLCPARLAHLVHPEARPAAPGGRVRAWTDAAGTTPLRIAL